MTENSGVHCRGAQLFCVSQLTLRAVVRVLDPLNMSSNSADFIQNICVCVTNTNKNGIQIKQPIRWDLVSCKYWVYIYTFQLKWDKSYCVFLDMYVDTIVFKLYPSGIHQRM